jgi:tetratricopeptide (TPR) repeat protein
LPIDREATLKKAEKLLRQGKLDAAISEYVRVVDDYPRDWTTANTLGDLLVRAGQHDKAAAQYSQLAEHFTRDGFYPKAAALYKKILKFRPDDEAALLQLGDISARQGLFADAKAQLGTVAERRRARGDRNGADEILVRIGSLDPGDFEARLNAARLVAERGDTAGAAARYREVAGDLFEKNREKEALSALKHAVRLDASDVAGRTQLARAFLGVGDVASAREFLDERAAGDDPGLLLALAEVELRDGKLEAGQGAMRRAVELDPSLVNALVNIGWSFCQSNPQAAFMCIDAASDVAIRQNDFQTAASILEEYVARATLQIPALLKLVEVCVDGGLEETMYETQAQLCDAYLGADQPAEARTIAEDLVAREPWDSRHIERFRQALVMLKVPDPDMVIAARLNGQVPFVATDRFVDEEAEPPVVGDSPEDEGEAENDRPVEESVAAPAAAAPSSPQDQDDEVDMDALRAMLREVEGSDAHIEVDLTSELGAGIGASESTAPSAPRSIGEAFARAREHAQKNMDAADAAEQLKLAKVYIDGALPEQAIAALEQAARSPRHRFEAASALARLYWDRKQPSVAIEWMERAVEAPSPSEEERRALLYELGVTLEQQGENARALAVFLELLAEAGDYRDAQARASRLSRVETGS